MDLRIASERQALPQDMTLEEVQKGGEGHDAWFTGSKIKILRFMGIKSEFSRITQNSAFDFICCPHSIAKLRYRLSLVSRPRIPDLQ